eukprot:CAMPEP_0172721802 /NCGR_PEP_ID=MMETSP1074-20121228/79906_1 /TAXON_ID=2916 /ORGANISM="Ceratium fusus, Strain PA161109" /LENGTH=74 /DNA_ID=CAMNT_0013547639 /DNA_START=147 /DNA_END=371 /DNA_ORIENTATION=-
MTTSFLAIINCTLDCSCIKRKVPAINTAVWPAANPSASKEFRHMASHGPNVITAIKGITSTPFWREILPATCLL